jgi:AraC-like DNA-binding protein
MTVKLTDKDLNEMTAEIPTPSFSKNGGCEESLRAVNNSYAQASFAEIRMPHLSITDIRLQSHREDLKISSHTDESDAVWFCAALQGNLTCHYHPSIGDERWQKGYANLLTYNNVESYLLINPKERFRMLEVMLSSEYIKRIAEAYPPLFEGMIGEYSRNSLFRAFPENIPFCPAIGEALNDLLSYKAAGNAAQMYLDAKILEILSLFVCKEVQKKDTACACHTAKDHDRFIHAKTIIEEQYLNPPSLRDLALMVGTNDCKLKNGFKTLFGTTVFGHLFDYRMKLARQYLLDTGKSIQEIAEAVGYEYHSHFTTAFKRKFHVSPQEYRCQAGIRAGR